LDLLSYIIVGIFSLYGLILLYITYLTKKKGEKGAFLNNLINSLVLLISISINLVIINIPHITQIDFIIFPFDILILGFVLLFFPFFYLLIHREKKRIILRKASPKKNNLTPPKVLPLKYEIYRKLTHLVVLGIIFFYFTLGYFVQNLFVYLFKLLPPFFSDLFFSIYNNIDNMIFTQYLVVCLVGISLIGLFTAEFIRILKPEAYPLKSINKILREKERHMRFGPQISMGIGCFSIIIIYGLIQPRGPLIICTSMTMAIFGDMAANLFGRTFGHNKIRNTNKTYEGLIAGIIIAFFSGIIVLFLLNELFVLNLLTILLLPLIGALIIGFLDFLDLEIDDNLTYNFIISTVLFFFSFIII
jgi:CDP-diglyceride synthetase